MRQSLLDERQVALGFHSHDVDIAPFWGAQAYIEVKIS